VIPIHGGEREQGTISHGVALEHFADCLLVHGAWVTFALAQQYHCIVLAGQCSGTEKTVYYMNAGHY
jgi:hypothetical protein